MSQSHRIKGRAADKAFQAQCFLWERGVLIVADFGPFQTFKKHNMSPLKLLWWRLYAGRLTVEGIPQRTG